MAKTVGRGQWLWETALGPPTAPYSDGNLAITVPLGGLTTLDWSPLPPSVFALVNSYAFAFSQGCGVINHTDHYQDRRVKGRASTF